jgi:hypothetical protein
MFRTPVPATDHTYPHDMFPLEALSSVPVPFVSVYFRARDVSGVDPVRPQALDRMTAAGTCRPVRRPGEHGTHCAVRAASCADTYQIAGCDPAAHSRIANQSADTGRTET